MSTVPSTAADGCARLESEARIEGDRLVIALHISTLANAARNSDYFFDAQENGTSLVINDEAAFAASVCNALNVEAEDGSTLITRMLDKATEYVAEQGEEGIDEAEGGPA